MRDLERQIGAKLFEKGRRARLTPLAQTLLPIFSELAHHARPRADGRSPACAGRARLGLACGRAGACRGMAAGLPCRTSRATIPTCAFARPISVRRRCVPWWPTAQFDIGVAGIWPTIRSSAFSRSRPIRSACCALPIIGSPRAATVSWKRARRRALYRQRRDRAAQGPRSRGMDREPSMVVTQPRDLDGLRQGRLGITVVPLLTRAEKALGLVFVPLTAPRVIAHARHRYAARPDPAADRRAHARADADSRCVPMRVAGCNACASPMRAAMTALARQAAARHRCPRIPQFDSLPDP